MSHEIKDMKPALLKACFLAVSSVALTMSVPGQPLITTQPLDQTNYIGITAIFTVAANGTGPLSYQWQKYSTGFADIAGQTNASLTLINVQTNDAADYRVQITDTTGTTNSQAAHLYVAMPATLSISLPAPGLMTLSWPGNMALIEAIVPKSGSLSCALWFRVAGVSPVTLLVRPEPRVFRLVALPTTSLEHSLNLCRGNNVQACEDCIQSYFFLSGPLPASAQMEEADSIGIELGSCFCVEAQLPIGELNWGIQPQP